LYTFETPTALLYLLFCIHFVSKNKKQNLNLFVPLISLQKMSDQEISKVTVDFDLCCFSFVTDSIKPVQCTSSHKETISGLEFGKKTFGSKKEYLQHKSDMQLYFYPIYVYCFLDNGFKDKTSSVVELSCDSDCNGKKTGRVSGSFNPDELDYYYYKPSVIFQAYITTLSDCGAMVRQDVGNHVLDMNELLKHNHGKIVMPLKLHNESDNMLISSLTLSNIRVEGFFEYTPVNPIPSANEVKQMVREYISMTDKTTASLCTFIEGSDDIFNPTNPGQITFENTSIQMPLAIFSMNNNVQFTTTNFWEREFDILINRHILSHWHLFKFNKVQDFYSLKPSEKMSIFVTYYDNLNVNEKASLAINLVCQYVQMLEYVCDYTFAKGTFARIMGESFGDAFVMQGGDCEDFTLSISQLFRSFLVQNFSGSGYKDILNSLVEKLKYYIPLSCIEGVSSNNVYNAEKKGRGGHSQNSRRLLPKLSSAHAAEKFIPIPIMINYIEPFVQQGIVSDLKTRNNTYLKSHSPNDIPNEIMVGEGTGLLEGGVFKDKDAKMREMVYSCGILEKTKKFIVPVTRENYPFYKALIFCFTDEFIDSSKIGTFTFVTKNPRSHYDNVKQSEKEYGRGVIFSDFITKKDFVHLKPQCFVDKKYEYSDKLYHIMRYVAKNRIPIPILHGFELDPIHLITSVEDDKLQYIQKMYFNQRKDSDKILECLNRKPITHHNFSKQALELLKKMVHTFHTDKNFVEIRSMQSLKGIIYVYLLEEYVDEYFVDEVVKHFSTNTTNEYAVGDCHIFREYHDNTFYVYRCDFHIYK
jgi:hypothetical protein